MADEFYALRRAVDAAIQDRPALPNKFDDRPYLLACEKLALYVTAHRDIEPLSGLKRISDADRDRLAELLCQNYEAQYAHNEGQVPCDGHRADADIYVETLGLKVRHE